MSEKLKIGIVGCGFVGGALKSWIEDNNSENCEVRVSDPPKGMNDDLSDIDVAFLQIHVPTEDDGTQDLTLMTQLIKGLPDVPVFVRTPILPGTSERLSKETFTLPVYPELTSDEQNYIIEVLKKIESEL